MKKSATITPNPPKKRLRREENGQERAFQRGYEKAENLRPIDSGENHLSQHSTSDHCLVSDNH